jgi:hypothetical protein
VLCLAEEACDKTTKGDWQPCAYQRYRWRMDQEVGHLYALFGGPEEDEVRVKGRRLAKAWLAKAHDSVEGAREHMGLQLRRASKLNTGRQCQHDGPRRVGRANNRPRPPSNGPTMPGKVDPGACESSAANSPAGRPGVWYR